MRRVWIGLAVGLLAGGVVTAVDGPLTPAANLRVRANENGYLLASAGAAGLVNGPLTNFANLRLRTNENGYLLIDCSGCGGSSGAPADAEYWVGAANATLTMEQNLGVLATALVLNTAGVPSAYTGIDCTNQFVRDVAGTGAGTCASVVLTADVTGLLPYANFVNATAASVLVGRGSAAAGGVFQEITLGTGLTMTGTVLASSAAGAPTDATYITQTANGSLSAEQALSTLSSGIMRVATTTGVITSLTDSAGIAANISDETGSGVLVFGTTPTFTTSVLLPATNTYTADASLMRNTTDASDTGLITVAGGGAVGTSRGAQMAIAGNEQGSAGSIVFKVGNVANSEWRVENAAGSLNMFLLDGATSRATFGATVFVPSISSGAAGDTDACLNSSTNELTDAGGSSCIVSSMRYKEFAGPLDTGLAEVLRLHSFSYSLKNDPLKIPQIGLSAEEMNDVEPRLVFYEQSGPDKGKPRGIMYEQSVALLVKAIQELEARVRVVEAR